MLISLSEASRGFRLPVTGSSYLLPVPLRRSPLGSLDRKRRGELHDDTAAVVYTALIVRRRGRRTSTRGRTRRGADHRALRVLADHLADDGTDHRTTDHLLGVVALGRVANAIHRGRRDLGIDVISGAVE